MLRRKSIGKWLIGSGLAIFACASLWVSYVMAAGFYWQEWRGNAMERQLGFSQGSPYVAIDGKSKEVFTIKPVENGVFDKAGFEDEEIVLDYSITRFYKALHESRGGVLDVRVVKFDHEDGPPLEQRAVRTVRISVPPM